MVNGMMHFTRPDPIQVNAGKTLKEAYIRAMAVA